MEVDPAPVRAPYASRPKLYKGLGWLELPQAVRMAAADERACYAEARELAHKAWLAGDHQKYWRIKELRARTRSIMEDRVDYEMRRFAHWCTRWDI